MPALTAAHLQRLVQARQPCQEEDRTQRVVLSCLNKLTPEKYEVLLAKIVAVVSGSDSDVAVLADKVWTKALREPLYSDLYARLSVDTERALSTRPENGAAEGALFRRLLLATLEREFERRRFLRRDPLRVADKRRALGCVRFLGCLFRQGFLHADVVTTAAHSLLEEVDTPQGLAPQGLVPQGLLDLECLCKLLSVAGAALEEAGRGHAPTRAALEAALQRLEQLAGSGRLGFRLWALVQDLLELRARQWRPRRRILGPSKLSEIRQAALEEQQQQGGFRGLRVLNAG